jgi:protoporphyrinogen oxidase
MSRSETTAELLEAIRADVKEFAEILDRYIDITRHASDETREKSPIYGFQQIKGALQRMLPKVRGYSGKFNEWDRERVRSKSVDTHAKKTVTKKGS